ncbi:MAG: calcium/sodium antiporter [Christensenellales bacterium]
MFLTAIWFLVGLVFIIKGGDFFVDAASWIGDVTGIPRFIIGATIVSLATTMPELLVSVLVVFQGKTDMGIGNAVGSVTCNLGVILGISVVVLPAVMKRLEVAEKGLLMMVSAAALWWATRDGMVNALESILLLVLLGLFVTLNILSVRKTMTDEQSKQGRKKTDKKEASRYILMFFVGATGIVVGAQLLVDKGTEIARFLGVSEKVIGLTMIAMGTSLPELVTTLTALAKKESSMSVGNIFGANLIDLTLILPVCSLLSGGLPVSAQTAALDIPVSLLLMAVAVFPALCMGKFKRWQGVLMIGIFAVYLGVLIVKPM